MLIAENFLPFECDLCVETDILAMFKAIRQKWDGVDVLINNGDIPNILILISLVSLSLSFFLNSLVSAGLGHPENLISGKTKEWREVLDVNIIAVLICTRETLASMEQRGTRVTCG